MKISPVPQPVSPLIIKPTPELSPLQQRAVISATALFSQALALNPPSDTPVYAWIDAGPFRMGSDDSDTLAESDERPRHEVWLDGFWIQRTEVTKEQYKRCVDAKVCDAPPEYGWDNPRFAKEPVTSVDWFQASQYAAWVGGRLPSEADTGEKACQGTDDRIYPWGNEDLSSERFELF